MHPSSQIRRGLAVAALAVAFVAGCDDGPSGPVPGELVVRLETPNATDRAVMLSITGPAAPSAVVAARAGDVVYSEAAGTTVKAAVFGRLASGDLLRLSVADVKQSRSYAVTVVEAADSTNALRASLSGYRATVVR
jgi:hypothetical protein